jgi:hypothetical protein
MAKKKKPQTPPCDLILGHDETGRLKLFQSEAEWRTQTTAQGAAQYLRKNILVQLSEIPAAIEAFKARADEANQRGEGVGFWSMLRMTLAPVGFLGALYKGKDNSENAIDFIDKYVGDRCNKPDYKRLFPLVWFQFRHGLVHTAMPKTFERAKDKKVIGWGVTLERNAHLHVTLGPGGAGEKAGFLMVCPEVLAEDVIAGVQQYTSDFDKPTLRPELLENYKAGFVAMGRVTRAETERASEKMQKRLEACLDSIFIP